MAAEDTDKIALTVDVVASFVSANNVRPEEVPALIASIHAAIKALGDSQAPAQPEAAAEPEHTPAVSVRKSLASPDHIVSLIDGKPYRTLKRHLATHGLTSDAYRARYGLKSDYPMVARSYSEARRTMAKALGPGRKAVAKVEAAVGMGPSRSRRSGTAASPSLTRTEALRHPEPRRLARTLPPSEQAARVPALK